MEVICSAAMRTQGPHRPGPQSPAQRQVGVEGNRGWGRVKPGEGAPLETSASQPLKRFSYSGFMQCVRDRKQCILSSSACHGEAVKGRNAQHVGRGGFRFGISMLKQKIPLLMYPTIRFGTASKSTPQGRHLYRAGVGPVGFRFGISMLSQHTADAL